MAALEGQLIAAPQRVRWEELMAARQPEQIRSNAQERERGAAPNRGRCVPEPLIQDLPELLTTRCVRTPTIRILFRIFIRENGLKGAPSQIQIKPIHTGERRRWRCGEERVMHRRPAQGGRAWFR